jgi:hypothetical protein
VVEEDDILRAVAEALEPIPDLHESAYVQSQAIYPMAEVIPGEIVYDPAFTRSERSTDELNATVRITVGTASDLGAQKQLRRFRAASGSMSVKAALEADPTLGGLVDSIVVGRCSPARQFRRPDGDVALGIDFDLEMQVQMT